MAHLAFRPQTRTATIAAVVLFHAVLIYLFALSIGWVPAPVPANFPIRIIPEQDPPKTPTEIVIPREAPPKPQTPDLPRLDFNGPSNPDWTGDGVAPRADPRYPLARPDYPAESVRLGEEGSVILALLVGIDGRVADARVERSSGHPRLDAAALAGAKRNFRFLPGTRQGVAAAMWHRVTLTFRLSEAQGN